jgi:hypothetical protein
MVVMEYFTSINYLLTGNITCNLALSPPQYQILKEELLYTENPSRIFFPPDSYMVIYRKGS